MERGLFRSDPAAVAERNFALSYRLSCQRAQLCAGSPYLPGIGDPSCRRRSPLRRRIWAFMRLFSVAGPLLLNSFLPGGYIMSSFQLHLADAARQAINRLDRQAKSGNREAASILVNAGAAFLGKSPRPLPDLPAQPDQEEIRRAAYNMLRTGKLTPEEAADIVRTFA